ncbi:DNA polymerase III subunit beta [Bradyrhizobium sp. th.b2]|uniref:DNA polymerase III subunit beta n=1 Tax=Bradyrhizobium sp. th-b2 TaxID=172088 RepID=UPI0009FC7F76|nr:DNA polymerase III subunit beta [Bradyrhizobium sp. th.b2]
MKVILRAKPLATMLSLAASCMVDAKLKKIAALDHARLAAEGDRLVITANVLDFVLKLSLPSLIEAAGEVAIRSEQLATLAAGFRGDAELAISSDETMVSITCGRSRFKLPTLPVAELPPTPVVENEVGCIALERSELLALLSKPAFAISTETTRYYLNGILLHDTGDGLAAVATDGHRLARVILPGTSGLSQDRRLIVPRPAMRVLLKLLADRDVELLTLRRSAALIEITTTAFSFISKLIDAEYPAYERLVPASTNNTATVDHLALVQAVARIAAVASDNKRSPLIGLTWKTPEKALQLCTPGAPEIAEDTIEAEVSGQGRLAIQIKHLMQLLGELKSHRVRIDAGMGAGNAILITDPDNANFTIIQMPCAWRAPTSQAN